MRGDRTRWGGSGRRPAGRAGRRASAPRPPWPRPGKKAGLLLAALLGGVGLFAAGRAAWAFLLAHPALAVREVSVRGVVNAPEAEILRLAGIRTGESWLALDRKGARYRVRSHPWVHDVRVRRPRVGVVRLDVRECVPVASVVVGGREYGLCRHLRILPGEGGIELLPLIREVTAGSRIDGEALARGMGYVRSLRAGGIVGREAVEIDVGEGQPDQIRLPERGFSAVVENAIVPGVVARNVRAFLEKLDGTQGARGTLRLISERTAVWKAAA